MTYDTLTPRCYYRLATSESRAGETGAFQYQGDTGHLFARARWTVRSGRAEVR